MDGRGDSQWSLSRNHVGIYSAPSPPERVSEDIPDSAPGPGPAPSPAQERSRSVVRTQIGEEQREAVTPRQDSQSALREGQAAGQVGNAPGATAASPNGTSNFYGTGGIPIFPEDITANGKAGARQ